MTTTRRWLGCVMGLCFFCLASLSGQAAEKGPIQTIHQDPKYQGGLISHWTQVMGGCIDSIRRANPESQLDAVVEQESIKYAGTEDEGVQLEKCMTQYGFPIVSMNQEQRIGTDHTQQ